MIGLCRFLASSAARASHVAVLKDAWGPLILTGAFDGPGVFGMVEREVANDKDYPASVKYHELVDTFPHTMRASKTPLAPYVPLPWYRAGGKQCVRVFF